MFEEEQNMWSMRSACERERCGVENVESTELNRGGHIYKRGPRVNARIEELIMKSALISIRLFLCATKISRYQSYIKNGNYITAQNVMDMLTREKKLNKNPQQFVLGLKHILN